MCKNSTVGMRCKAQGRLDKRCKVKGGERHSNDDPSDTKDQDYVQTSITVIVILGQ